MSHTGEATHRKRGFGRGTRAFAARQRQFTPVGDLAATRQVEMDLGTHEIRINAQPGPLGHAYWARCSCGWSHRGSFATRGEAEALAELHLAEVRS